jgi:hypothetical protein
LPFCRDCGNQIGEGDQFCKLCGAAQQPGAAPGGQPPQAQPPPAAAAGAAAPAPSNKTPFYLVTALISILVLAGVVVGTIFLVRGCGGEQAVEEADKYVAEALGYIDEVDAIEDDLIEDTKALDFSVGTEQFQVEVSSIKSELQDATVKLDAAASSLQKIDKPSLPDWWDTYITLLGRAYKEKRQAYQEWDEFITRMAELDEFEQAYNDMLAAFEAAHEAVDQAYAQHDAGCSNWATAAAATAYQNAKNLADLALAQLNEVIACMERASQLEPDIDFTYVVDVVYQFENYLSILKTSADYGIAANLDAHYPQCEQVRTVIDNLPWDISLDIASWIAAIRDEYIASIEYHLAKEAEYRRRAAEVWAQNNP